MKDRFKFRSYGCPNSIIEGMQNIYTFEEFKDGYFNVKVDKGWLAFVKEEDLKIMQCTGLKDKNGKLIYEGDIVKINENYCDYSAIEDFYKNQNFIVEYFQPRAVYLLKPFEYKSNNGSGIYDLSPDFYEFLKWKPCGKLEEYTLQGIEVIGNIYENPELLKEESQ